MPMFVLPSDNLMSIATIDTHQMPQNMHGADFDTMQ